MEQQNRYHVIVSERATQMLVSHAAFLVQASPEAAERLTVEFEKRYMMILQIVDDIVYADHVVDCRQDHGWLIR
ncbi:MAG: hypothetical protein HFI65_01835 [Lachnospiraceae bacterium]|nr:hypothetical protein [Lachnospiraceae bacterium]